MYEKIKEFFKKTWKYIVSFFVGISTMLCINSRRNKRANKDIEQLRNKLAEYAKLLGRAGLYTEELEQKLTDAESRVDELEDRFNTITDDTREVESVNDGIRAEQERLGTAIEQLRDFIEKNGTKN